MRRLIAPLLAAAAPLSAGADPAPAMTCYLAGSPEPTTFVLLGDDLVARTSRGSERVSTAGSPLLVRTDEEGGAAVRTYADHSRNGAVVTRRVYVRHGEGPRQLRYAERYDFAAQTIVRVGEATDTCRRAGR